MENKDVFCNQRYFNFVSYARSILDCIVFSFIRTSRRQNARLTSYKVVQKEMFQISRAEVSPNAPG